MTAPQFKQAMYKICGRERGNQSRFAALLGLNRSTVGRYLDGSAEIPEVVALAVRTLKQN